MVNRVWIYILLLMVSGTIVKSIFPYTLIWVAVDLAVLFGAYVILRRNPYVDMRSSMIFMGGLTTINILVDFGIMSGMMGNVAMLVLLAWMMLGGGRGR